MTVDHTGSETIVPKMTKDTKKPLLVMSAGPVMGHSAPALHVALEMAKRGFEVIFMTAPDLRGSVEKIGAEFYETTPFFPAGSLEGRDDHPVGLPKLLYDMRSIFLASIAPRAATVRSLLEMVRERDPSRDVVVVVETASMGVLPFMYGAPLPKGYDKFPRVININVIPLLATSDDLAPFGPGLPPDTTESGRARNKLLNDLFYWQGPFKPLNDEFLTILKSVGCTKLPKQFMFDAWTDSFDTCFQMCSPSLEYPRSDLHSSIRFAGALPKRGIDPNLVYPSWWSEIKENAALPADSPDRKKVIPLAQGTIATDCDELIIPAMKAFASRSDVIVIAILGVKDAKLPAAFEVPANVRVVDFLPYDAALEYADVFVSNGGYGGMMHGVINGVPMVVAGITEDKVEVTARAEYAGFAINLKTQTPTSEQIASAADKILNEPKYKRRAVRLMQENEDMDSLSTIEREIFKYTRKD
ncbi:udp-glucuronosyl udp-glucosyltransferase [Seiridium cupressi]